MVMRTGLALAALLAFSAAGRLAVAELPDYRLGDTAREDIVAPLQLVVIDAEETAALRQKEAMKVPVIFRFATNAADKAESALCSAFTVTRSNFLERVQPVFKRYPLTEQNLASPRFQRLAANFQRQNKSFPMNTNLARLWAQGDSDRVLLASLAATLRETAARPLRPAVLDAEFRRGMTVRLVPVADWSEPLTLAEADQRGLSFARSNVLGLVRARDSLLQGFPVEERATARFLVSLLRTNCVPDAELTRLARTRHTDPLWVADRYEAGQIIVKRGEVIDKKIKAALDQVREKTAIANLQQQLRQDQAQARAAQLRLWWMLAGLAGLILALGGLWVIGRRRAGRKVSGSLLPARIAGDGASASVLACPTCAEAIVLPDAASAPVSDATGFRARLISHLARLMADKMVRKLITQRADLLDAQQKAIAEMAELGARLEQVHAPLQDRLRAYEQRIADLEQELAQKGKENRELIRTKIWIAKRQLEAEKTKDRAGLN